MNNKNWALPVSIIIAGLIIGGTIYYSSGSKKPSSPTDQNTNTQQQINGPREISSSDHVLGSPNADLTFFVFTDFECPFCKTFNSTINQMMEEYGKTGKVQLVLRDFPLDQLHSKARKEAEAAECAADQGGNDKFFAYVNRLFEITPSNDGLDPAQLPQIAQYVGLNVDQFNQCLNSGKLADKVQTDEEDAIASGAQGTPYAVIVTKNGEKYPIGGALPYSQLKIIIDQLLNSTSTPEGQ
jgi:protein-disulfide isomerase